MLKDQVCILPYNRHSRGARLLRQSLGIQMIQPEVYRYEPQRVGSRRILNWGFGLGSDNPAINPFKKVNLCSDKVKFFTAVQEAVRIPEFTKDPDEAVSWVQQGLTVLGRSARGSCGKDIKFYEESSLQEFIDSDFWVVYKKKKEEYRVHIAFGNVILVQKKSLRKTDHEGNVINTEDVDFRIRNLSNGFVFQRHDFTPPEDVVTQAKKAIEKIGLDFGAVDVIYNAYENQAYVLEVNTAPGLEGSTVDNYTTAFRQKFTELGLM